MEDVWNDLLGRDPFSLLCGYPVTDLGDADVERVTSRHTAAAIENGNLDLKG